MVAANVLDDEKRHVEVRVRNYSRISPLSVQL